MRARMVIAVLGVLAACGGEESGTADAPPQPVPLTVWNSTQTDLEEVRVHAGTEYLGAANLLSQPLPDDGRVLVDILYGQHVTVIRRNVAGGQRIAFTTASALNVDTPGYVLQVFQESFRLLEPEFHDGPPPDGGDVGPADGGDTDAGGDP